jgi:octaprenyl-diphosphate synthase
MHDTLAGLEPHLAEVQRHMHAALATDEPQVADLIAQLGSFHGKMLRPSLVLMVAQAVGNISAQHHRIGAALELIHTATLIHDDLIDDATTRRGNPTAHVKFNNTTAVLLGDYFYTHAFNLIADLNNLTVMKKLTATTNIICQGELHQQCVARNVALTEQEYNRIIYAKTAVLCELAGELGAVEGSSEQQRAAAAYGRAAGMAFQVVDDCLDFSGDPQKVGKTLSTDIERGRLTLPIIRLLERSGDRRAAIEQQLVSVQTPQDVAAIRELIISGGGVDAALETAREYVTDAQRQLGVFGQGPFRQRLFDLAAFIVARDF